MTTIVYDHKNKQIACDSRETADGCIVTDMAEKWLVNDTGIWFICGSKSDKDLFADNFNHNDEAPKNIGCSGLVVIGGVAHKACIDDGVFKLDIMVSNEGVGSGGWYCQSAVDLGKTAKESVEYSMTRDIYSGGKVHVYDIKKAKFI
jgi:hypothetical protein